MDIRPTLRRLIFLSGVLLLLGPPSVDAEENAPVRFAVIGDQGTGKKGQYEIAELMAAWHRRLPYKFVITLGDNFYGFWFLDGGKGLFRERFDKPYAELLRRGVIFRASIGNHDKTADMIADKERFHIEGDRGYYTFTAGSDPENSGASGKPWVQFFVLNSDLEELRVPGRCAEQGQCRWLKRELAKSTAIWKIAYFHHPLYSTGQHGSDLPLRKTLEPILTDAEYGVDLVFAGHDHFYQRFPPQRGVYHIVSGAAGEVRKGDASSSLEKAPTPACSEDSQQHFLLVEAEPERLRLRAVSRDDTVFEDCTLNREGKLDCAVNCAAPGRKTLP